MANNCEDKKDYQMEIYDYLYPDRKNPKNNENYKNEQINRNEDTNGKINA